jgi:hypothetical protein
MRPDNQDAAKTRGSHEEGHGTYLPVMTYHRNTNLHYCYAMQPVRGMVWCYSEALGSESSPEQWKLAHSQLHGDRM